MNKQDIIDLRSKSSSGGLTQTTINIIEQNTGTQVNYKQLYTELEVESSVPTKIYKYEDNSKSNLLFDITINWADNLPSTITIINVDDDITTTISLTNWVDGIPTQINKVES
ncbi:MAG: hypothetical protein PVF17_00290 [Ignavibacteria bacterium]|jgi:hypothetical protein